LTYWGAVSYLEENNCDTASPSDSPTLSCDGPETEINVTVTTDRYNNETSWTLLDVCNNNLIAEKEGGDYGSQNTAYIEIVKACASDFEFNISDSFGDGICCGYSYFVRQDGIVVAFGGEFGARETSSFGLRSNRG